MSNYPKLTNFVSEIDKFLQAFDEQHPTLSLSQQKEQNKYRHIYYLRDVSNRAEQPKDLWDNF